MCTSVYPPVCHRQTEVFAQTENNEITSMTHGTFIKGSFHIEVFTLFESMPSSEPPRYQYVDAFSVLAVRVTSLLRISDHTAGAPRDPFLEAKPPRQPVQPFSKIDPKKIQHPPQISLQAFEVKSFCRHRMTKMERLLFKNVSDGFPARSVLKRERWC